MKWKRAEGGVKINKDNPDIYLEIDKCLSFFVRLALEKSSQAGKYY